MFQNNIRAWHPKLNQMFKVAILNFETDTVHVYPFISDKYSSEMIFAIKDVILHQESGMFDESNLSTFEGDILDFEGTKCVLTYGYYGDAMDETTSFGWHLDGKQYKFKYVGGAKKIGNIFENSKIVIGDNYVR